MEWKGLSRFNNFELKLYRIIGIYQFQKIILFFEKTKHKSDNQLNENYHPSNFDIYSVENYKDFLLFHILLHTVSLLLTFICYLIIIIHNKANIFITAFLAILTVINIYCIILQRTSYLRIRKYCLNYYKRFFSNKVLSNKEFIFRFYDKKQNLLMQDYEVICRIKNAFDGYRECFLKSTDTDSLNRIYECVKTMLPKKTLIQKANKNTEINFLEKCKTNTRLFSKWQLRIKFLQKLRYNPRHKKQGNTPIITENADCEACYRKLVPLDSIFYMSFLCFPIYEIYNEGIKKESRHEA